MFARNSQESRIESGTECVGVHSVSVGNVTIYVTPHGVEVAVDLPSMFVKTDIDPGFVRAQ